MLYTNIFSHSVALQFLREFFSCDEVQLSNLFPLLAAPLVLCLRNLWLTQGHEDFLFFLLKFLRGLALTFRTLVCIGVIFVYGVRERSKFIFVHGDTSHSSTCIIAFVCCLLSPPLLLPGGEQHCPPAAASALTSLSLRFTRPTDS